MSSAASSRNEVERRTEGGRERRRVTLLRSSSRELKYEGEPRYCRHGVAPRWTSWTDENPGRRFYGCRYYYDKVTRKLTFFACGATKCFVLVGSFPNKKPYFCVVGLRVCCCVGAE